jgi:protein SCO1/2/putative membrane protein
MCPPRAAVLALAVLAVFAVQAGAAALPDDTEWYVGDFRLTDQDGHTVSRTDLHGKIWVASFIFTRCAGPCARVSATMARLQNDIASKKGVLLVSYTVDPDFDTPAILQKYAAHFAADPQRWRFLTGKRADIYRLIGDSFHLAAHYNDDPKAQAGYQVDHSTRLVVVDGHGRIRGLYDGDAGDDLPELEKQIGVLWRQQHPSWQDSLPAVNAVLNGTCAFVLVLGYVAIRRGRIVVHRNLMLTALAISAVFLASYLYFHLLVRQGQPTPFTGVGWVRRLYLGILLSHSVLAAVVAPLAIFTAYQGLRGRLSRHMAVARWTLPLWFYVSVTGVVVYVMLYQLYPQAAP